MTMVLLYVIFEVKPYFVFYNLLVTNATPNSTCLKISLFT